MYKKNPTEQNNTHTRMEQRENEAEIGRDEAESTWEEVLAPEKAKLGESSN